MSQNWMGLVRFFEFLHFLIRELDIECRNGLVEMIHFGRTNNWAVDIRLVQNPCESDLRTGDAAFFRDFGDAVGNIEIFLAEVQTICKRVCIGPCSSAATAALPITREESACHR